MKPMTVRISDAFSRLAAHADYHRLPRVVIRGDRRSMVFLLDTIAEDLSRPSSIDFRRGASGDQVGMFAGVEFRQFTLPPAWTKAELDLMQWRKHFGMLAEIMGGENDADV